MNISGSEMGIMALVGLIFFGGLLKTKSKPTHSAPKSVTPLSQTNSQADFQKTNTTSSSPVKVSEYSKAN